VCPIASKDSVSQKPKFQLSCLGQFLVALLVLFLVYWLIFWPIQAPPVGVQVPPVTAFRLSVRGAINGVTGGYLTKLNEWSQVGIDYMIIQMFTGLFDGISQGVSNMFQGVGESISVPQP